MNTLLTLGIFGLALLPNGGENTELATPFRVKAEDSFIDVEGGHAAHEEHFGVKDRFQELYEELCPMPPERFYHGCVWACLRKPWS